MSEIPVVLPHAEMTTVAGLQSELRVIFASGPREEADSFREEITIQVNSDKIVIYAHAWGLLGGVFEDRSSCRMAPSES